MGTRADFYIKKQRMLRADNWIGSIAWDGYPDGIPAEVLGAQTEQEFRSALAMMASQRNDFTFPEDGWPWPWNDSSITDFAYVFSCQTGRVSWRPIKYPNMSDRKDVQLSGKKSGLIVIG